ncbi:MAG: hypothetical protein K9L02_04085 [Acholeplasmataceae bacterium]|nr:hypothetical protein [Acholeplasmataceae bacterium]
MRTIRDRLARAKSLISIKTYKRPLVYIILLMILINLIILTIAAVIALFIDNEFDNFIDAFANGSLKWMLAPNAILSIQNPDMLVLAVIVLVTGLILFSGTIIALTTNAIKDYIQKKNSGAGKINLDQHIVILNWNNKVPELVSDLLYVEDKEVTVMILANIDKTYAERQIINAIKKTKSDQSIIKMNVLVKHGDPLLLSDLEDISIEHAKAILIMNPDHHQTVYKNMSKSDLAVIKVILGLGPIEFLYEPPIVVEIKHIDSYDKILTLSRVVDKLHEHIIMPICFDKRLGQIIAQTLIENQIEDIYMALFSFQGSEVYAIKDISFDDCLKECSHAIPLSCHEGLLYVLSLNDNVKTKRSIHQHPKIDLKSKSLIDQKDIEIYIIGENNKLQFILESLNQYEKIHQSKFQAKWIEDENIALLVEQLNQSKKQTSILLLSDEKQTEDALDANVIDNLIFLEGHLTNPNVHIIVELLNPRNDPIVKDFNINNTIISNKIISLLLSKLALYKDTAPFYEDLLTIEPDDDNEDKLSILIKPADKCFNNQFPIVFQSKKQLIQSVYGAFNNHYMILGYYHHDELQIFENDLHQTETITIEKNDRLILIRL